MPVIYPIKGIRKVNKCTKYVSTTISIVIDSTFQNRYRWTMQQFRQLYNFNLQSMKLRSNAFKSHFFELYPYQALQPSTSNVNRQVAEVRVLIVATRNAEVLFQVRNSLFDWGELQECRVIYTQPSWVKLVRFVVPPDTSSSSSSSGSFVWKSSITSEHL